MSNVKEIDLNKFEKFKVTGIYRNGRRFRPLVYTNPSSAFSINLYALANDPELRDSSVWGITKDGKQKLLKRVYN
jgi:hypothetical protein